jgi:PAS domain S-box-containing protein/putative nucleotidyltransferase with HDIG domain
MSDDVLSSDTVTKLLQEATDNIQEIAKLRKILNKIPVSVVITDENGVIEYVNPYFSQITGYSFLDAVGQNPRILKSDFHSHDDYMELWKTISTGDTWSGVFKNLKKDGSFYWESAIIAPIEDKDGKVINYIGVKQEITEQMYLKRRIAEQNEMMSNNFEKTLEAFVSIVEDRDSYTGGHSQRVATYSQMMAREMGFSDDECELIYRAGILHDIGKISTPDNVLLKPDKLSELEYKLIKRHVDVSYAILSTIPMYKEIADIVICHHERHDGKGYPYGLRGEEISVFGRIMIVADAFDAMTTNRIYKIRKNVKEAILELNELSSKQFHPEIVKVASKVLQNVTVEQNINQIPKTELEKERFAYFYRDQTTDAYNSKYLNYVLNQNALEREFICVNVLYMHHFSGYNSREGWAGGDLFLKTFASELIEKYPNSFVFRIHGDDFVVVSKTHEDVVLEELLGLKMFENSGVILTYRHIDLRQNSVGSLNELEILILKS